MIDHWLDEQGRQAIERMGWPEGVGAGNRILLLRCMDQEPVPGDFDYVALALLRDHAREWLEEHGWGLTRGYSGMCKPDETRPAWHGFRRMTEKRLSLTLIGRYDIDAALKAAVLAVGGE